MTVLIGQMETLAVLILIGFLAKSLNMVKDESVDGLMEILSKLVLPCMLLTLIGSGGSRDELFGMWKFLLAIIIMFLICLTVGFVMSRMLKLPQNVKNLHIIVTAYGNGAFVGVPVVAAMFPENSGLAIAVYSMSEAIMYWAFGPIIADASGNKSIDLKKVITPLTVSIALGILVLLLNLNPSENIVWETLKSVGGTAKYFAAIYIGLDIGRKGFKKMTENPNVFAAVPFKLVILPIITYIIVGKTGLLSGQLLIILTLFTSTPSGMALPIVARMAGSDDSYATSGTMSATILCLITMPLVMWLTSYI